MLIILQITMTIYYKMDNSFLFAGSVCDILIWAVMDLIDFIMGLKLNVGTLKHKTFNLKRR